MRAHESAHAHKSARAGVRAPAGESAHAHENTHSPKPGGTRWAQDREEDCTTDAL